MTAIPPLQSETLASRHEGPIQTPDCIEMTVRLRFTRRKRFRFLHGAVVHGLLCHVFGHDLPRGLVVWPAESGRVSYEAGDPYVFSIVLAGQARRRLGEVQPALHRLAAAPARRGPRKALDGNFLVESVTSRQLGGGEASEESGSESAADGEAEDEVTLRFLSPLRLKRPKTLAMAGGAYLDQRCFPAAHFLRRLFQRWHLLAFGAYPRPENIPEPPENVQAKPGRLLWVDLPIRGKKRKHMTLGGVLGDVTFTGLTRPWLSLLDIMQPLHAGASTQYGLGRYVLTNRPDGAPTGPGRRHLDDIATTRRLAEAVEREARTGGAGSDGVTPEAFVAGGARQLDSLAHQLSAGTYRPDPLIAHDGHAVPTVRDRVVQRAVVEQLAPVVEEVRKNTGERNRHGATPTDIEDLAASLPMESAVELVRAFATAPVRVGSRLREQVGGVRVVSPLSELFVRR